jgi:hypothetical protein
MDLWRISKYRSLSGEGGRLFDARWNSAGHPVVYLADSPAGAVLEVLVHLELQGKQQPPPYTLLHITAPDGVMIHDIKVPSGGAGNQTNRSPASSAMNGFAHNDLRWRACRPQWCRKRSTTC